MNKINVEYINIKDIIPYKNNPRHNENAIPYVMKSIEEFGFKNPVILDKNNVIVCGHTRIEAAKRLGIEEVPVIYANDLADKQIKAFRLADNKVSELAEWDYSLLDEEIEKLKDLDIDLDQFGFDTLDEDIQPNDYVEQGLKENKTKLHICPNCQCEFED